MGEPCKHSQRVSRTALTPTRKVVKTLIFGPFSCPRTETAGDVLLGIERLPTGHYAGSMDSPQRYPWIGKWKLESETGLVDWLIAQGATTAEATAERDIIQRHTTLTLAVDDDRLDLIWSTNIRGRLRRAKTIVSYSLDGVSVTTTDTPLGSVSTTAAVEQDMLVHRVTGPRGTETHRRHVVDGRLHQTMTTDDPALSTATTCELIWRPTR